MDGLDPDLRDESIIDEPEVLEELEEIDTLSLIEQKRSYFWSLFPDLINEVPEDIFVLECVENWISHNSNSTIPLCLVDLDLQIRWKNEAFLQILNSPDENEKLFLPELFNFNEYNSSTWEMKNHLEKKSGSYSWAGRIKPIGNNDSNLFLKIMIQPLAFKNDLPYCYICTWDIITKEFKDVLQNTFLSLLEASKLKDNDTGFHIERVNFYSRTMSLYLKGTENYPEVDEAFIENISFLAAMHDVGKIGTPDDILNKEGPLEPWERKIMNEHTKNGAYILSTYPNPMARDIALSHHEKWDGTGYPYGIFGEMIPLAARIVAIADVYDALRSKRSYKESFSHEVAKEIIREGKGNHFDPGLIDLFFTIEDQFNSIYMRSMDS